MISPGPSSLLLDVHQTPTQRVHNIPLQRRSPSGSEIDLPQAPPQSQPQASASSDLHMTWPVTLPRACSNSYDWARLNAQWSNALKCRKYQDKIRAKRKEEEMEYLREKEKNDRLRKVYFKKESNIKRLKEYYMNFLSSRKCIKKQCRKKLKVKQSQEDNIVHLPDFIQRCSNQYRGQTGSGAHLNNEHLEYSRDPSSTPRRPPMTPWPPSSLSARLGPGAWSTRSEWPCSWPTWTQTGSSTPTWSTWPPPFRR